MYFIPSYILERVAPTASEFRQALIEDHQTRTRRAIFSPKDAVTVPNQEVLQIWDAKKAWKSKGTLAEPTLPGYRDVKTFAQFTLGWFNRVLNRNSIDNRGSVVHITLNYGVKYPNAFWNGSELIFGKGDGAIFTDFSKSLDVIAHEMSHGVVQATGGLVYQGQSGALNEHFADVFGTTIQQAFENADKPDWLIGDEVMGTSNYGEALRSMSHPGTAYDNASFGRDFQPGHMKDIFTGIQDNGGVHINSGIVNRMFYLVAQELGTQNAARLWYSCLLNLWPTAQFAAMVQVLVHQARKLGHSQTINRNAAQVVRAAAKEVGL